MNETQYKYFVAYCCLNKRKKRGIGSCIITSNRKVNADVIEAFEEYIKQDIKARNVVIINFIEIGEESNETACKTGSPI